MEKYKFKVGSTVQTVCEIVAFGGIKGTTTCTVIRADENVKIIGRSKSFNFETYDIETSDGRMMYCVKGFKLRSKNENR